MPIRDIAVHSVVTLAADADIREAAAAMRSAHVGDVIVTEPSEHGPVPVGLLTDRDIVVALEAREVPPKAVSVGDIMTRDLVTIEESQSLAQTLGCMQSAGVRRVPVVDGNGVLSGIVTVDDIVSLLAFQLSQVSAILRHERESEWERRP